MTGLEILQLIAIILPILDNSINLVDGMAAHIEKLTDKDITEIPELRAHVMTTRDTVGKLRDKIQAEIDKINNAE